MTTPDRMELLRNKCRELGQAEVARKIGKSDSAVSQVLSGKYKGDPAIILQLVEEAYGGTIIQCPVLGPITLGRCAQERKKPFAATNPVRIRLYKACRECKGGHKP